ncbi:hypothetical protein [Salinicoccus roseus]|uniref:hypothetical protein n=1 Tax=Salinicoccus roseus TaxID=45670 RepID=UPI001EF3E90F|nr:hypothetical protein [Salinicoccus roseus]MCG7331862.1 hypothetical protein [Salinicoccus roseus]
MFFNKKQSARNNVEEIDRIEIPELEKILYYLLAYKQLVNSVRLFNVTLFSDISNEHHIDFEGNIDEFYMSHFKEDVAEITADYKRLTNRPYKINKDYNSLLNTNNKTHFIHLSTATIEEINSAIKPLDSFIDKYVYIINKMGTTQDFTLHETIKMSELMGKFEFLESYINEIENYLKLIK